MKKGYIILLVTLIVGGILAGIGGIVLAKNPDALKSNYEEITIVEEETVTSFNLSVTSDDVFFLPATDGKLTVIYCAYDFDNYKYAFENGKATFEHDKKFSLKSLFSFRLPNKPSMRIYLPTTVTEELNILLTSGEVTAIDSNIALKKLNVTLTSGEINIAKINAEALNLALTSGSLNLSDMSAKETSITNTSGSIDVKNCSFGNTKIDITSGKLTTRALSCDSLKMDLTSGNVKLGLSGSIDDYSIDCEATSGNITLFNGTEIVSEGKDVRFGSGAKKVSASVTSGNMTIAF